MPELERSVAMAKDLNKVQMTGRLGADPEMRYTPQGHAVTTFRVASNRSWRNTEGESHEETEWFRVVAWNKLAEICNQWLLKGSRVYVEGRMQTRQWQDQDGQTRYLSEVIANDIIILDTRRDSPSQGADESSPQAAEPPPSTAPAPAPNEPVTRKAARATTTDAPAAARGRTSPATPSRAAKVAALPRGTAALEEEDLPF
jgi:single-strand DNA-binding protein